MNFIPEDTRKNKNRDEMNFPNSLPSYKPQPCDFQIPNNVNMYDRNFFQNGYQNNNFNQSSNPSGYQNNIMENRIHELNNNNMNQFTESISQTNNYIKNNQYADLTRERRCDRNLNQSGLYNPISQRDFYRDIQKQNNFLGHIPMDTRNTRSTNSQLSNSEMRPTRYIGTPYNKIE